ETLQLIFTNSKVFPHQQGYVVPAVIPGTLSRKQPDQMPTPPESFDAEKQVEPSKLPVDEVASSPPSQRKSLATLKDTDFNLLAQHFVHYD
ncbi:hypothetical protein ILYODFUR_018403, partial [Ilyodon furcidens]